MTDALKAPRRLMLAGLDPRDIASAAHPYLHLAGLEETAANAAARRGRTARFTPGGLPQPPEVMGVDADARVPNLLQPMSGEFASGHEVDNGRPDFFGQDMPAPTGLADGVGVERGRSQVFGAPTGMVSRTPSIGADRFNWRPPLPIARRALAALPHFADGGLVPPGQAGVVGEQGQELVKALPGGGAQVTPLPHAATAAPASDGPARTVPEPPSPGIGTAAFTPPPPDHADSQQSYAALAHSIATMRPPDPNDPALRTPAWKRALGIGLGALAAGLARRPDPALGLAMYEETSPDLYTQAEQRYQVNQRNQLAALGPLLNAAKLEQGQNAAGAREWQTEAEDALRRQQADATTGYRTLQLQQREQSELERERQDQALDAERTSNQQAMEEYRRQVLGMRRQLQATKSAPFQAQSTQQALRDIWNAGSPGQAQQYLAAHRSALAARGANLNLLQRAIAQRWPGAKGASHQRP
jgi:hypothetical protein